MISLKLKAIFVLVFVLLATLQSVGRVRIEALEEEDLAKKTTGKRWALIIGVEEYEDAEINSLRYSVDDAEALYNFLTDPDKGRFKAENVRLLVDSATEKRLKPIKANILHYLKEWLVPKVEVDDTVLIFFSGHGMMYGDHKYLLPADTDTFYTPAYAIDNLEFIEAIDLLKAEKVITLLDSCHSGGVSRSGKGIGDFLPDDFYSQFESAKGRVTLASCDGNEQSFEWEEKGHGVFTYFLLDGLNGSANQDGDAAIGFDELAEYVGAQVSSWAKEYKNGKQNPQKHGERQSTSSQIAVAFDTASGYQQALLKLKDQLPSYIGKGESKLPFDQVATAMKVIDRVTNRVAENKQPSAGENNALRLIVSLVEGEISVSTYQSFHGMIENSLQETSESPTVKPKNRPRQEIQPSPEPTPLKPAGYGKIKVICKPWAEIYLNGKNMGQTPKILTEVAVGKHRLVLKNPKYQEMEQEIEVILDQTVTVQETLAKSPSKPAGYGKIKVTCKPWAEIYLDGKHMGQTPKILTEVAVGKHRLVLKNPKYQEMEQEIEVILDQTVTVQETLAK
ncbi:MAG: PEGA domain-containing protein [Dehalococcoidia bacterium]|nr:PEGA domain-containing protein [Dehalococcoidia bacterium]